MVLGFIAIRKAATGLVLEHRVICILRESKGIFRKWLDNIDHGLQLIELERCARGSEI